FTSEERKVVTKKKKMNRTPMSQSYVNSQAGQSSTASTISNNNNNNNSINNTNNMSSGNSGANTTGSNNDKLQMSSGSTSQNQRHQQQSQQQPQQHQHQQFQQNVPPELTNLLLEFAFSVFVNKPANIVEYAANYFQQLSEQRNSSAGRGSSGPQFGRHQQQQSQQQQPQQHELNRDEDENDENNKDECMIDDDGNFDDSNHHYNSNKSQPQQPKLSFNRRKSVFAEQYDPAADDDDDENDRVVHAKSDEQRARLAKAIQSIFIFRAVDPQDMADILDAMFEVKCKAGDVVIRQGDDGDNFYVVERGKFQICVTRDDGTREIRGEYEDRGSFGELALMYNQPRAATVIAVTDGSLWAMDRNTFRKIVLKRAFKKRKEYEALFEKVSVLQCLNGYERMNLCDALVSRRFEDGQQIIRQGDQANGMYFIESGRVKIVKETEDGRTRELAILQKGDYFGELALINHKPRAASACAIGNDVKVAFLDVKAFERLLGPCIDRMEKNCAIYLNELARDNV
ncbi:hypothetical protein GZH46_00589, partial [Fragariocoptes setiger]